MLRDERGVTVGVVVMLVLIAVVVIVVLGVHLGLECSPLKGATYVSVRGTLTLTGPVPRAVCSLLCRLFWTSFS